MTTLNLDSIIDVTVSVSPTAAARGTFNEFLIVGTTGLTISNTIQVGNIAIANGEIDLTTVVINVFMVFDV